MGANLQAGVSHEHQCSVCPQMQLWSEPPRRRRVVVLTGRHLVSDPEVQLYQRVLQQMNYEVQLSRYAETSSFLRSNHGNSSLSDLRGALQGAEISRVIAVDNFVKQEASLTCRFPEDPSGINKVFLTLCERSCRNTNTHDKFKP